MDAAARLHRAIQDRATLQPAFQAVWRSVSQAGPHSEAWAAAALELVEVNAGPSCHLAFWSASAQLPLAQAAFSGQAAAQVCRHAGSRAALACLRALPGVHGLLGGAAGGGIPAGLAAWWSGLQRLAEAAADCVSVAAGQAAPCLADRTGGAFTDFVAAGLKAHAADAPRRRAFFALEDPFARALLARRPGIPGFEAHARLLTACTAALWGKDTLLRTLPASGALEPRTTLSGPVVLFPSAFPANSPAEARLLYLAAAAHACAHLAHPAPRRAVERLKPLQIVLINAVEDARVEALAQQSYPGLRRLWFPFHRADPGSPRTAPNLLARLARALFDPEYADADGFVSKGRALFAAELGGLADPDLSARIGRVLGHDLGQMRVPFNWRDYVVDPAYRDDGAHLWEASAQPASALDLMVQAAPDVGAGAGSGGAGPGQAGRAREVPPDASGTAIASYPEWDGAACRERPGWTTVRDVPVQPADPARLAAALAGEPGLRRAIGGLVRASVIGRPMRLRRQPEGDELDLDAAIDATIAMRAGHAPDARVFQRTAPRSRDLATVVMLDRSASTAARLPDGRSVWDVQCLAVALLAEALEALGDAFALRAFASNGREDVRLSRIKDFGEPFGPGTLARLAGLRPSLSTRLGTALRHARAEFAPVRAWRRLLLVLTDGEPSDVDVRNTADLVVDARRAVLQLRQEGIDAYGVILDPAETGSASAIFGRGQAVLIEDLAGLPPRLSGLYFRLARR